MKSKYFRILFFIIGFMALSCHQVSSGIPMGTLIGTYYESEYLPPFRHVTPIEEMHFEKIIFSPNEQHNGYISSRIIKVERQLSDLLFRIQTQESPEKRYIFATSHQKFYDPNLCKWIDAQYITESNTLETSHFKPVKVISNTPIADFEDSTGKRLFWKVYSITTWPTHRNPRACPGVSIKTT